MTRSKQRCTNDDNKRKGQPNKRSAAKKTKANPVASPKPPTVAPPIKKHPSTFPSMKTGAALASVTQTIGADHGRIPRKARITTTAASGAAGASVPTTVADNNSHESELAVATSVAVVEDRTTTTDVPLARHAVPVPKYKCRQLAGKKPRAATLILPPENFGDEYNRKNLTPTIKRKLGDIFIREQPKDNDKWWNEGYEYALSLAEVWGYENDLENFFLFMDDESASRWYTDAQNSNDWSNQLELPKFAWETCYKFYKQYFITSAKEAADTYGNRTPNTSVKLKSPEDIWSELVLPKIGSVIRFCCRLWGFNPTMNRRAIFRLAVDTGARIGSRDALRKHLQTLEKVEYKKNTIKLTKALFSDVSNFATSQQDFTSGWTYCLQEEANANLIKLFLHFHGVDVYPKSSTSAKIIFSAARKYYGTLTTVQDKEDMRQMGRLFAIAEIEAKEKFERESAEKKEALLQKEALKKQALLEKKEAEDAKKALLEKAKADAAAETVAVKKAMTEKINEIKAKKKLLQMQVKEASKKKKNKNDTPATQSTPTTEDANKKTNSTATSVAKGTVAATNAPSSSLKTATATTAKVVPAAAKFTATTTMVNVSGTHEIASTATKPTTNAPNDSVAKAGTPKDGSSMDWCPVQAAAMRLESFPSHTSISGPEHLPKGYINEERGLITFHPPSDQWFRQTRAQFTTVLTFLGKLSVDCLIPPPLLPDIDYFNPGKVFMMAFVLGWHIPGDMGSEVEYLLCCLFSWLPPLHRNDSILDILLGLYELLDPEGYFIEYGELQNHNTVNRILKKEMIPSESQFILDLVEGIRELNTWDESKQRSFFGMVVIMEDIPLSMVGVEVKKSANSDSIAAINSAYDIFYTKIAPGASSASISSRDSSENGSDPLLDSASSISKGSSVNGSDPLLEGMKSSGYSVAP